MVEADREAGLLADAVDAGQQLLRGDGAIERLARGEAVVARAAIVVGIGFGEIAQELGPSAHARLGVVDHLLELGARDLLFLLAGLLVNEELLLHHVAGAEEQDALARQSVAAGAAGFLVVALDILRQVVVDDEADVRLVDAHAEGDGGADHPHLVAQEQLLVPRALLRRQPRVIGPRRHAILRQVGRDPLRGLSRHAVDDAAVLRPLAQEVQQLVVGLLLGQHAIGEIRPVEAGDIGPRLLQLEVRDDVRADAVGRRGRERHEGDARQQGAQRGELAVFGAEIVAPFADAVRLVHRDQLHVPPRQVLEKAGEHQALRGHVEQPVLARVQPAQPFPRFVGRERRIQERGRDAGGLQRVHLVLHQRDQRRHHEGQPRAHQRRQLETERLPAARRQQREDIAPRQRIPDDLLLQRPERREAEIALQRNKQIKIGFHRVEGGLLVLGQHAVLSPPQGLMKSCAQATGTARHVKACTEISSGNRALSTSATSAQGAALSRHLHRGPRPQATAWSELIDRGQLLAPVVAVRCVLVGRLEV